MALKTEKRDVKNINISAIVRVVPIKDIITMLDAFAIADSQLEGANFYIIGPFSEDKEYYDQCRNYRDFLGLKKVEFTGQVDVKNYLKKTDILVMTSISEGQPLVYLEGLASKLPFVTTNVGDYRSLIAGEFDSFGPAGLISNVMDSAGVAKNIVKLAQNVALRRKYGEAGYKRVDANYRLENVIEKYRDIYNLFDKRG